AGRAHPGRGARWPPRGRGGDAALAGNFAGAALRQSRHAERHDCGACRTRHAQAPAPRTRADHHGELLVRRWKLAIVAAALLTGCSSVRMVYDNVDTFIRWRALQFLDVHGE